MVSQSMNDSVEVKHTDTVFDVLVIGSGATGGWAAKEFCERGFKTLMIERGRMVEHRKDYVGEGKGPWQHPLRNRVPLEVQESDYPVQSACYAFDASTRHFFGNDRELPYSTEPGTTFSWIRGNQLGGRSLLWARQCYRWSDFDFAANARDGHGNDWPVRYADIAPWYAYVEKFVGISGSVDGLPQLPDSDCLPPFDMTSPEIDFKKRTESAYKHRHVVVGRTANLSHSAPHHAALGRASCQARNECSRGCSFGAYFSTLSATLPAALKTGNLRIAPDSVVHSLIHDPKTNRVRGVRVIDNNDLSTREYFGKIVFLCASTLASTQILLNSRSPHAPNGLGNQSGTLGHYLMDHNYNAWISGSVPGYDDEYFSGRRPTGIYVPNFHYEPSKYHRNFLRGYAFGGGSDRGGWQGRASDDGFGEGFKQKLQRPGPWSFNLYAQGEMLPRYENQVSLHPTKKDKWGMPQLHFNCSWSDNERAMMESAAETGAEMMRNAGFENITTNVSDGKPGHAIHEVGTARMGIDPAQSVFNRFNQSHEIPNLFCTDGSTFCSTATQNPTLTFMAFTVRAVDYAAREHGNHRL